MTGKGARGGKRCVPGTQVGGYAGFSGGGEEVCGGFVEWGRRWEGCGFLLGGGRMRMLFEGRTRLLEWELSGLWLELEWDLGLRLGLNRWSSTGSTRVLPIWLPECSVG